MKIKPTLMIIPLLCLSLPSTLRAEDEPVTTAEQTDTAMAEVLGKKIAIEDANDLGGRVLGELLDQFILDEKIEASPEDIAKYVSFQAKIERDMKADYLSRQKKLSARITDKKATDEERAAAKEELATVEDILGSLRTDEERTTDEKKEITGIRSGMATDVVKSWKANKALFAKYGGRVLFQQAGPEPLDAYRDFLKERQKAGAFKILDPKNEPSMWRYFTTDGMHTFLGKDEGAAAINTPPWELAKPPAGEERSGN